MALPFRLLEKSWWDEISHLTSKGGDRLRIVCPFIKVKALEHVLSGAYASVHVITRFSQEDWAAGVSDHQALRLLLDRGARVRGVRNLHAKLYVFGEHAAILGSTNLTTAALKRNHELGAVFTASADIEQCAEYFDRVWAACGPDLTRRVLTRWTRDYESRSQPALRKRSGLGWPDHGAHVPLLDADQGAGARATGSTVSAAFVKFFGTSENRWSRQRTVLEELHRSGCHWACGYPRNRRPRNVRDGDVVFMGRLVGDPDDTLIFGRAKAYRYVEGRDEASAEDIAARSWKREWPHYIRFRSPELINGNLGDGVSLGELMRELGSNSFVSTQQNARSGRGNTDPRASLGQKPAVRLTAEAFAWLNERLDRAFASKGKLDLTQVHDLEWPADARGLTVQGAALLDVIRDALSTEAIDVEEPGTFLSYRDAVKRLGLKPMKGPGLGAQLRRGGLDDLDLWARRFRFPAITGFIVNHNRGHRPGATFFRQHGRSQGDVEWWRNQVREAASFDWDSVL